MTNVFNFSRKNRGNRDRKKNDTWIISMWPFNQYRVLKINVTRNIYHKAPDVHIFHIIDEKKTRWEKEQVPVRPLHWNSFSVYHHDWNDRTFRHVAAKRIAIVITRFEAILTCFYSFLQCCCCCCLFFFSHNSVFTVTPSQMKVQASQYRKSRIWEP